MPNSNSSTRHLESITAKARAERILRDIRRALGGLSRVDEGLPFAITRDELVRLIHRAVLEYHVTPHVSLRAAHDVAVAKASRLIERRGPRGDDA